MKPPQIDLPDWVGEEIKALPEYIESVEDRMSAVIQFSRLNYERSTGGPFAAGIFESDSGKLVTIGVNRVVPLNMSSAHAEIVAITMAQKLLGTFDLGGPNMPHHQIVVNGRPCAMCFGSLPWSGIRSLVVGASGEQIEELTGFDEGPIHPNWRGELEQRGIEVTENLLGDLACDVFRDFAKSDQPIYNGRAGEK